MELIIAFLIILFAVQTIRAWHLKRQRKTLCGMLSKTEAERLAAMHRGDEWFRAYHQKSDAILGEEYLDQ